MTNFVVIELLYTKPSWEAMGISNGQLPSTMIFDQYGNEQHPYMTMNGIIIDENSPELFRRMRKIIDFPPSAMLPALAEIEKVYNEVFEEDVRVFRQRGPFHILDKIQQQHIRLQNLLFLYISTIDSDIKARCSEIVKSHHEALSMKEKLELLIAMKELDV